MRFFYSLLFYLLLPVIFLRLYWKSIRLPSYRTRLGERLGYYQFKFKNCIWVHSVSVGETLAVIPLVKALKVKYPNLPILMTTMTPTGAARVKSAFGEEVKHAYLPYDLPSAVKRFLETMNPIVSIIMETELWPNLLHACQKKNIPICLINARLSEKSARGYHKIQRLTQPMLSSIKVIAAHGEADATRFLALGASKNNIVVTGNIKFDLELPKDLIEKGTHLRQSLGDRPFIWVAASTHQGEEEIILKAHEQLLKQNLQALLVLVPRHPNRFPAVAKLCQQQFTIAKRSLNEACDFETNVYLGDTMGEMLLMYAAVDVAFVGGSFIPRGGHNMLEPAALGKPILTGPHLFNFAEISELFIKSNALKKVNDVNALASTLTFLMQNRDECKQMGLRAKEVINTNRGALAKQLKIVSGVIDGMS